MTASKTGIAACPFNNKTAYSQTTEIESSAYAKVTGTGAQRTAPSNNRMTPPAYRPSREAETTLSSAALQKTRFMSAKAKEIEKEMT